MLFTIIIAFVSLIGLMILHEFGHFIVAKRFGVKVEEFGIGYPPRIFGKKIGETIYSLNLLPFGAFVKIQGEIGGIENARSFNGKPIYQRGLIILAGVISFWLISAVLFSIVMGLGAPTAISDEENGNLVDPKVQIAGISAGSPAEISGLKVGDAIIEVKSQKSTLRLRSGLMVSEVEPSKVKSINKVKELQEFTEENKGEEIVLTVERGKEIFTVSLVGRILPPSGEGPLGVALVRTAIKNYHGFQAIWQGILATINLTYAIIQGYWQAIGNLIKGLPSGVQMMGPVGVVSLFAQVNQMGINYFLQFVGMIAIYFAIFNVLPIPAVDGGKLLFLVIEAVRKKPVSEKIEQNITALCFSVLIILMIFVTIKDVMRIF